ncbi:hypothetical protein CTZ24_00615 [Pantoea phytobeneficialis]|uniref:Uncharacterized protein n=1 Tax=Pantoea phytobeneficialis TaxID=2052056 RepID=A0AAP9H1P6_9GAMM|nr:hypothetical protein CTZ24_00615 [Pantoea phytobeneficialis]
MAFTIVPFLATHTEALEQAGAAQGQAIRCAEQSESARRARMDARERRGGTGMFHPRRSVRQMNAVKAPRQRREDRQPLSDTRLRYHRLLN